MSFASLKQTKYVIPQQLEDEDGTVVTITKTKKEMLEDFNTKLMEESLVLYFKECKPLVCKNPILDSLEKLFPYCVGDDIVGQQIVLHGVKGKSGNNDWYVIRINDDASLRLQSPDTIPEAMKRGVKHPTVGKPRAQEEHDERNPPPPNDADAEFFGNEPGI